ncbi:MAG TPA: alpha/beta fold hydrolase [Actinomycetota bacterium]|jgi:3-oxoadipate enol-lactonase|nr:alpha/beta fold hydrolase [Actinomycetota bacterium]
MADGLLLLHAFPVDARMWQPQLEALDGVPIAAPNHPGFGGIGSVPDVMTMELAAANALRALDDAVIDRAVVCGLSMGGYVALELWRRSRERVAGFVFADTRAGADTEEGAATRRALAARLRAEGKDFFADGPPGLLGEEASAETRAFVRSIIADQPAETIAAASLGMAERPDSTPDLPGIDVPTLVITGSLDTLIPPAVTAEMAERIPGARLELLEGAGHLSNLERPEDFTRLLSEHLERAGLR